MNLTKIREYTRVTLENESGTFTVQRPEVEICLRDVIDDYLVPLLNAAGYQIAPDDIEINS